MMKKLKIKILLFCLMLFGNFCFADENRPEYYLDNYIISAYFTPSMDCENAIIERLQNAQKVDIAVYAITNDRIVDAIIQAYQRGANIRVISDKLQSEYKNSLIEQLIENDIPVRLNKFHKIEHNKFAIFDDIIIETGSYNWTNAATYKNSENCIFFKQINNDYVSRFQYLWNLYE